MNEILNQKFGVEVEMYNITRAKAAVVVKKTLEAWTHETYAIEGPGLFGGLGIGNDQKEAVAYFLDAHGSECKKITAVRFYKNR